MLEQNNFIKKLSVVKDDLVIEWDDEKQSRLYSHWLRDHCQMPKSRNANNGQRLFSVISIPKNTSIEKVKQDERGDVHIQFMPENYWSIFSASLKLEFHGQTFGILKIPVKNLSPRLFFKKKSSGYMTL